jgi:photosystem II stability/assembly factor-like uncharacterized protein
MPRALSHALRSQSVVGRPTVLVLVAFWASMTPAPHPLAAAVGSWQAIGPDGGSVVGLAVDPADPATAYAATGLELFKTVDAGTSWLRVEGPSTFPLRVVLDPATPATVYAPGYGGIAKSTDGGLTWSDAGLILGGPVLDLVVDPRAAGTLYAAHGDQVLKSLDGGNSWTASATGLRPGATVTSLAIDPGQPAVVYAGTTVGVLKSVDAGATWRAARTGMGRMQVAAIAVDPSPPGRVYAGGAEGLFVSVDGGAIWTARPVAADNPAISCLAAPPSADGTIYACGGSEGLFKSADGAGHWTPINSGLGAPAFGALAIAPTLPSRLYAGVARISNPLFTGVPVQTAGAVVYMTSSAGAAWIPASQGLRSLLLANIAVDPSQAGTLYVGTLAAGMIKSSDDGGTWTPASHGLQGEPRVNALLIDPVSPSNLYLLNRRGFFSTRDDAAHWLRARPPLVGASTLAIEAGVPSTLYCFIDGNGYGRLEQSLDGGATWRPILTLSRILGANAAIGVSTSAPDVVYLAFQRQESPPAYVRAVFVASRDGGKSFQVLFSIPGSVSAFAVAPSDANTFYFSQSTSSLNRSTDGGRTLVELPSPGFVSSLAIDPANPSVVYAAIRDDVMVSRDGGSTWSQLAPGLPTPGPLLGTIGHLAFGPGGTLYLLTAFGVFRVAL